MDWMRRCWFFHVAGVGFFLPLALAAIFGAGCRNRAGSTTAPAVSETSPESAPVAQVTTIRPSTQSLVHSTQQPGTIEAYLRAPLYAMRAGYVARIHVDIGDPVRGPRYDEAGQLVEKGQVLAELFIPELDEELHEQEALVALAGAEVLQAQAAVEVAHSAIATAEAELERAEASVDRADAQCQLWASNYERTVELAEKKGAVTPKLVDETKQELEAAKAGRREAQAQVKAASAAIDESQARAKQAAADENAALARQRAAEAKHARTLATTEYKTIRAPFDGTITQRNVDPGHLVQPSAENQGRPLFTVVQTDVVRIFVDVSEADATLVGKGDRAAIRVQASSDRDFLGEVARDFLGEVARTAWVLDAVTRTLRVEIDIQNPDGELRPGMFGTATIHLQERPGALTVPAESLVVQDGKAWCYYVDGGKVAKKAVKVGLRVGPDVEVVSGLTDRDEIIAGKLGSLTVGQAVEVKPAPEGP